MQINKQTDNNDDDNSVQIYITTTNC